LKKAEQQTTQIQHPDINKQDPFEWVGQGYSLLSSPHWQGSKLPETKRVTGAHSSFWGKTLWKPTN
jgi:hypothetical protein